MENIFQNMRARGSRLTITSSFIDGITILHPTKDAEESRVEVDLTSSAQQMVLDFLAIGNELERIIPISAYVPFYLENSIIDRPHSIKYSSNKLIRASVLNDSLCPFLSDFNAKKKLESAFLNFLNSYCAIGFHGASEPLFSAIHALAFSGIIQHQDKFAITSLTALIYQFAEVYYRYKYPSEFIERLKTCHNQSISVAGNVTVLRTKIELTNMFENGLWIEYKKVKSPLDLIKIHLMYSDTTEYKQCQYCGTFFATDNKRAVYCSPICRNRANVKRNYDKKKKNNLTNGLSQ